MFIENHFHVGDMMICILLWETSCALNEDSEILTFLTIQKLENYQTPIIMHHNILTTFPCLCHSHFLHGDKSEKEGFFQNQNLIVSFYTACSPPFVMNEIVNVNDF